MSLLKYIILKVIGCFVGIAIGTLVMGCVVWLFLTELFKMARSDEGM